MQESWRESHGIKLKGASLARNPTARAAQHWTSECHVCGHSSRAALMTTTIAWPRGCLVSELQVELSEHHVKPPSLCTEHLWSQDRRYIASATLGDSTPTWCCQQALNNSDGFHIPRGECISLSLEMKVDLASWATWATVVPPSTCLLWHSECWLSLLQCTGHLRQACHASMTPKLGV